ncbi:MAG: ATP-dependent helicase [Haloechinothrix sp.]
MNRFGEQAPERGGPVLVRRSVGHRAGRDWSAQARRVLDGTGFLRVLGGPGTGKTSLLAETAACRILGGADPEQVLVLTASRKAANTVRAEITRLLTVQESDVPGDRPPRTVREPLVRTVHSYAFGVLRSLAGRDGTPPPRLLSGPEQDAVVRELLAGDLDTGADRWPEQLRPALAVPGFAEELRDLLLRAAERGLGPEDLVRLGRRQRHREWVAAGQFWKQYEQVTLLHGAGGSALSAPSAPAMDAAELVSTALLTLFDDTDLLARERARIRCLLVDDAQHLDPLQLKLVRLIGDAAGLFVLAGDPDQAAFSFRGADPRLLADSDPDGTRTVVLSVSYRMGAAVHAGAARIAAGMAGASAHRSAAPLAPDVGSVRVRRFPSASAEAGWIADQLRRAHLIDGIPWSEMAVLVRSAARTFPILQRALRSAGVPIAAAADELPLARHSAVRPLLTALRAAANPSLVDAEVAEQLLASPLGGADPLALRRLRRGLRRLEQASGGQRPSDELLVEALRTGDRLVALADSEADALRRVADVLAAGRKALSRHCGAEQVLWELWHASGLQRRWLWLSERGGSLGRQADADLDAVVALFHAAGRYVDRLPHAGVTGFADYLLSHQIAGDSLAPVSARGDGVELLTAHGAAGREWTVVAVAGVQEGSWPDLRLRGSLLGVERMVDLLSGVDTDGVSAIAPILAEERRLFYLAASRTRSRLLVTAVQGEDEQPSRFLDDLDEARVEQDEPGAVVPRGTDERPLVLASLVGELRVAVCDSSGEPERRRRAARQLARLARAGVPGAHPDSWYGLTEPSTDAPLRAEDEVISVSPSTVDVLVRCPLRWLMERNGGSDPAQLAAVTGTLVHGLAQAAAGGATPEEIQLAIDGAWQQIDAGAPWFSRSERRRVERMVDNFLAWLRQSRGELAQDGVEADIEVRLPAAEGQREIRLRGRVDRLERDDQGRPVIVDLKTAKTAVSKADAQEHPQLAAYQLAASLVTELGAGGARLVYVAQANKATGAAERRQDPLDPPSVEHWLEVVRSAASASVGPVYLARESSECGRCPAKPCCPLHPEGRQVTS